MKLKIFSKLDPPNTHFTRECTVFRGPIEVPPFRMYSQCTHRWHLSPHKMQSNRTMGSMIYIQLLSYSTIASAFIFIQIFGRKMNCTWSTNGNLERIVRASRWNRNMEMVLMNSKKLNAIKGWEESKSHGWAYEILLFFG